MPSVDSKGKPVESDPSIYVALKSLKDAIEGIGAKSATTVKSGRYDSDQLKKLNASSTKTKYRTVSFGQVLELDIAQHNSSLPSIVISIADDLTKRYLCRFHIELNPIYFPPYRQQHFVLKSKGISLRTSIRIVSNEQMQKDYVTKMMFLSCRVLGFKDGALPFNCSSIAALRVVKGLKEFKLRMKTLENRKRDGIEFPALGFGVTLEFDDSERVVESDEWRKCRVPNLVFQPAEIDEGYFQCTSWVLGDTPLWNQDFTFAINAV